MSTLHLIRTLRRALADARDVRDERAVAELARRLVLELNRDLGATFAPNGVNITDDGATPTHAVEIHEGGMAVFA